MRPKTAIFFLITAIASVLSLFIGCGPSITKQIRLCPGSATLIQALTLVEAQSAKASQFRVSSGCCSWVEKVNGKVKNKESFKVKLWLSPPDSIRMQGDIAFDPKGLTVGSNQQEFWLALKPKEVSSYWWGLWSQQDSHTRLMLSPRILLEAFGIIDTADFSQWSLAHQGPFDVLLQSSGAGVTKKVYIYNCDKRIAKIEYFDATGRIAAVVELEKYITVSDDFYIPSSIKLTSKPDKDTEQIFTIKVNSAKRTDYNGIQQQKLFSRPQTRGFENIYTIINGDFFKQNQ